jgi:ABC-2 type transport system ATP-binding protein
MNDAIVLDRVRKSFGDFVAVNDISLRVPRGSIYGFLGPNGAGTTTTIRMMMSIFYPDSGSINILGQPNSEHIKDRLGYLPEEKGLYKNMKAIDLVAYFGRLKGMSNADARSRGRELLTKFGLGEWIEAKCKALSKGMGQKVQLLATLMHDPELVILDEPFSGLDPVNTEVVRDIILQMKRDNKTVIFSTHVMEHAEQICDHVVLINKGRVLIDGPITKVRATGGSTIQLEHPEVPHRRDASERRRQARRVRARAGHRRGRPAQADRRPGEGPPFRHPRGVAARDLRALRGIRHHRTGSAPCVRHSWSPSARSRNSSRPRASGSASRSSRSSSSS